MNPYKQTGTKSLPSRSLTASLPLKNDGKGRRSGFLLGFGTFSGAFAVRLREGKPKFRVPSSNLKKWKTLPETNECLLKRDY